MTYWLRVLASAILFLCGAALLAGAKHSEADRVSTLRATVQALLRRDYDDAFRIVLNYEKTAKPDAQEAEAAAEFDVGAFLQGGLEMMAIHDPQWSAWYLPEIQEKLPIDERYHVGMTWLRRAAYHGSKAALSEVSTAYHRGRYGLPYDEALAHCFEEAIWDKSKIEGCRRLEQIRDVVRERESRLMSGERLSPH